MKQLLIFLLILIICAVSNLAQTTVSKTATINLSSGEYKTVDEAKAVLLNIAKKAAVDEIFVEFIRTFSKVENFTLTSTDIEVTSIGFIRLKHFTTKAVGKNDFI
jgi:hypothetical protein